MTAHRFSFYAPSLRAGDDAVEIAGDEHRHMKSVLRMAPGREIRVTNGLGLVAVAAIDSVTADRVVVRITGIDEDAPPARRVILALSLLPRAHLDNALAQCVEVGMTDFVPLVAEACRVRAWSRAAAARATRVAVAAMKQSGRGWLPVVHDAVDVNGLVGAFGACPGVFVGDPDGPAFPREVPAGDTVVVVGPEAGFSAGETSTLAAAGARPAAVSRHRLRAETAALVLVSTAVRAAGR
jgi:16S rRNA (uracil1498-N3)-methyltransferase